MIMLISADSLPHYICPSRGGRAVVLGMIAWMPTEVAAAFRAGAWVEICRCNIATTGQRSIKKPRRNHSTSFKARVALQTIRGEKTVTQIAAHHKVHATEVTAWKMELL